MSKQQDALAWVLAQATERGWDPAEQNVQMVIFQGAVEVTRLPKSVRAALNAAVKSGRLMHMKKEGFKPEVYCKPAAQFAAKELRAKREHEKAGRLRAYAAAGK